MLRAHPEMGAKLGSVIGERVRASDRFLAERLARQPLFAALGEADRLALVAALTLREVQRGALIFQAGSRADQLFVVERGTVLLTPADPTAPEVQLGAGDLFGHEPFMRRREYGAVARALTEVQLWGLSRQGFERVAAEVPALRDALAAGINEQPPTDTEHALVRESLAHKTLFRELPADLLDAVAERLRFRHVGPGETLYRAGEPSDALFLLDAGAVELHGSAVERREAGSFFGEGALLSGAPREESARVTRSANLWVLAKRDFDALAAQHPDLTLHVARALMGEVAQGLAEDATFTLAIFPLFTGLTLAEQADVARRLRRVSLAAGDIALRRGALPDSFFLLRRGQIALRDERATLDTIGAGGFFGGSALLTGHAHRVTAHAVEPSELLVLDRAHFEAVLHRYPSIALVLSRALSARLEAAQGHAAPRALPTPSRAARPALPRSRLGRATVAPVRRSVAARVRFAMTLLLLLWLAGVTVPNMLLYDAQQNPDSPLRPLLLRAESLDRSEER